MNDVLIFTAGSIIFSSYMFFLGRMIWKQHKMQQKKRPNMFAVKDSEELNNDRKAS